MASRSAVRSVDPRRDRDVSQALSRRQQLLAVSVENQVCEYAAAGLTKVRPSNRMRFYDSSERSTMGRGRFADACVRTAASASSCDRS